MYNFNLLAKLMIVIGLFIIGIGVLFFVLGKIPEISLKLPGDIYIKRNNFTFYFPLGWCILISIVLSLIIKIFK